MTLPEQYAHDYRDMAMSEEELRKVLEEFVAEKDSEYKSLEDEWMKGKSKVECVNEVYQWVIDYLTTQGDNK